MPEPVQRTPLIDFLKAGHREPMPQWLAEYVPGDAFNREAFFGSRVVYYPGPGEDGHAVKLFGASHAAHCFVYADYGQLWRNLEQDLDRTNAFRGYVPLGRIHLREQDLVPSQWVPHITWEQLGRVDPHGATLTPFAFLQVLERAPTLDDAHGAQRLAVLFVGGDAHATYDALFCQRASLCRPFAVLLQDHGFSGNYSNFGPGGLTHKIAQRTGIYPEWIVTDAKSTWTGYEAVPAVGGHQGGMYNFWRYLWRRVEH